MRETAPDKAEWAKRRRGGRQSDECYDSQATCDAAFRACAHDSV